MNRYPWWKNLLIILVLLLGIFFALPNLYGENPALQISKRNAVMDQAAVDKAVAALKAANIPVKSARLEDRDGLIQFSSTDAQLKAVNIVREALGEEYPVALNLAPAAPRWMQNLGAKPMYLGLDLRGGVHFLMQIDMQAAIKTALERRVDGMRGDLRKANIRYVAADVENGNEIALRFPDAAARDAALKSMAGNYPELKFNTEERNGEPYLTAKFTEAGATAERKAAVDQNITTLRNRVNELGVAEPLIQQQGDDRIVVELPGIQDTVRAKEIIGATATLEFRLVSGTPTDWVDAEQSGRVPPDARLYHEKDGRPVLLKRQVIVTGDRITGASSGFDQRSGSPAVFVNLDGQGARRMADITGQNIGKQMGVVFIEHRTETKIVDGKPVKDKKVIQQVINVATIQDQLANRFQITGLDSPEEARDLALLLRAGALRAPMDIVEERTVGPSLGAQNIQSGVNASILGFALVAAFMLIYYRVFGLTAVVALAVNLILIVAVLSLLQATLTLPGIAGMVLTLGIAVDANVLINERIREELRNGLTPHAAIKAGYERAFATIIDSHVTTLLAAIVLFALGAGAVKGFAVTLTIGILASLFTAIMVTRALVNLIYGRRARLNKISI
ncbi:MAG: protein translocase subunit SecD [Halothiobacillus sp. 14-56-357]|jgi:preprotein translocase subunit SecD|uniref:protein translocase subunit SecD n=1 Tax=Halothiobacillus sp. 15-55-196 TaxID=1970382 RepID=UPI000BC4FDAB|nr:protein translocase subunit SecD [Halothiobacillus sp. 15-55-196]OZB36946.1 MAG: protein translocase subunit SecD [Halothiobacillus sp. 15-55-196]OZB56664.1 MAG: protein translocase subunit SecD [Halothiobacillus sp. 14-56-357]OZB78898.1 MAG: protein translocase subunit SecD [Halothiobacillus sp. 13-55-115]